MKTIAIIQSSYIPWKGYFDFINMVDEFLIYDDVQYAKRSWINRNKIKTPQGLNWISIPVNTKGNYHQRIEDTEISEPWAEKHWRAIALNYAKAPFFSDHKETIEGLYQKAADLRYISEVNCLFLKELCSELGITTKISMARDYDASGAKTDRLIELCKETSANKYISGPAAKAYMEEQKFKDLGIELEWMDYSGYPEYSQLHGEFEHGVSILDMLFNLGPETQKFMKSFGNNHGN